MCQNPLSTISHFHLTRSLPYIFNHALMQMLMWCKNSKHVPIFLNLQKLTKKRLSNIKQFDQDDYSISINAWWIIWTWHTHQDVVRWCKWNFCVMKGIRTRVIVQIKEAQVPYIIGVHCIAHHINLVGHNHVWGTPSRLQNKDRTMWQMQFNPNELANIQYFIIVFVSSTSLHKWMFYMCKLQNIKLFSFSIVIFLLTRFFLEFLFSKHFLINDL
jgi:hypothetical protein